MCKMSIIPRLVLLHLPNLLLIARASRLKANDILELIDEDFQSLGLDGWSGDEELSLSMRGLKSRHVQNETESEELEDNPSEVVQLPEHWRKYVLDRKKVGNGAFGDVARFQVKCPEKNTFNCAMKVIPKTPANDKSLENEISCMTEVTNFLDDPNKAGTTFEEDMRPYVNTLIAQPAVEDGYLFLASPFFTNGELQDVMDKPDAFGGIQALYGFMLHLAKGVALMHAAGWVHGDLKGPNAMVTCASKNSTGIGQCHASVIDYGLACRIDLDACGRVGSPLWVAPEVLDRPKTGAHPDPKTDVWSLGMMLYEIRFGRSSLPIQGRSTREVFQKIIKLDLSSVSSIPGLESEPDLQAVLKGTLTPLDKRWSMEQLIAGLKKVAPREMLGGPKFATPVDEVGCFQEGYSVPVYQCCYKSVAWYTWKGSGTHYMTKFGTPCKEGYKEHTSYTQCSVIAGGSCHACWDSCCQVRHVARKFKCTEDKASSKRENECKAVG